MGSAAYQKKFDDEGFIVSKKDGYLIFSEANALNPFIQISLYCYRMVSFKSIFKGYKTIDIWINSKGNKQTYGVERITRKSTLKKSLKKNNLEIKSEKFFRVFPNKTYLRSLYFIEKLLLDYFYYQRELCLHNYYF